METYFPKESPKPSFCLPLQEEQCKPIQDPSGPAHTMQAHLGSLRPRPHSASLPRIPQTLPTQCKPTQDPSGPAHTMQIHPGSLRLRSHNAGPPRISQAHPHFSKGAPLSPCNNLQLASLHCNVFVVSKCPSIACVNGIWMITFLLALNFCVL